MFDAAALVEGCRKAAGANVRAMSDDDLVAGMLAVEDARRALDAAACALVAELDARDVPNRRFGHRTRDWVASAHGLDRREAGRLCRVGRGLRTLGLDLVGDALADGRITLEHARVVVDATNPRVAEAVAAAQAELVQLAASMRFEDWARHVRALVDHADADGGHQPRPERRSLTWSRLGDELHVRAVLTGDAATAFDHLIESHADRLHRRARTDRDTTNGDVEMPTRTQLCADALDELLRAGGTALGNGTAAAPAADVTVTVPHDHPALGRRHTNTPACCGTGNLRGEALDVLLCDAAITAVVVDSLGNPVDVGRTTRHATKDQRRALAVRDGGCAFPGCDAPPRWCDAHHVTHWEHGGPTDLDNLLLLCRHHHGVVHRHGWTVAHAGGQRFTITTQRGQALTAQRHGRPPDTT